MLENFEKAEKRKASAYLLVDRILNSQTKEQQEIKIEELRKVLLGL